MAWFLVRERERELTRRLQIKDAERARRRSPDAKVTRFPGPVKTRSRTTPPTGNRKAA